MKSTKLSLLMRGMAALVVLSGASLASLPPPMPPAVAQPDPVAEPEPTRIAPNERGWRNADGKTEGEAKDRPWRDDWRPDQIEATDRDAVAQPPEKKTVPDKEILRQARRAVAQDKALSVAGHKVKIAAQGGTITLRGRVLSDAERTSIAAKAAAIVGADNVVNLLTVKTPKAK